MLCSLTQPRLSLTWSWLMLNHRTNLLLEWPVLSPANEPVTMTSPMIPVWTSRRYGSGIMP